MQYTASEIIERAKNLADCGNTDFLSDKEATQYINDAFAYVYQKLINRGDNFFVKKMTNINTGEYKLPYDFYQLRSIKDPYSGFVLTRKAGNSPRNEAGYSIINGKLIIGGTALHNLEVTYYPKPMYITLNAKEQMLNSRLPEPYVEGVYGIYGNIYCYTTEDSFSIYDYVNETLTNIESNLTIDKIYVSRSSIYLVNDTEINVVDLDGNFVGSPISKENHVLIRYENGTIKCEQCLNNVIKYRGKDLTLELNPDFYIAATERYIFYRNSGKLYFQEVDASESTLISENSDENFIVTRVDGSAGVLFYDDGPKIYVSNWNEVERINADFVGFVGFYDNKEYGMIYTDGVEFYKRGILPETVFNYPNNTYYTLIAYIIATYIIAKQGGDVSILAAQKEKAELDFEDNVSDSWSAVRIKNVY